MISLLFLIMLTHISWFLARSLVLKAGETCLKFQLTKCVSLHFNGHHVVPYTQFLMINGNTVNICNVNCTKFLGKTIDVSLSATHKLASDDMKQQVLLYLQCIDHCSIRGNTKCGS